MNLRDVAIGVVSSLAVSVLGGVVVYYVTREPPSTPPSENLVFQIDKPAEFQSATKKLALQTIRIANVGREAATDVITGVEYPESMQIVDSVASLTSGPASSFKALRPALSRFELQVPVLVPNEVATITLMLDQPAKEPPVVAVKSRASVGASGSFVREVSVRQESALSRVLRFMLPLLAIAQIPVAIVLLRRIRSKLLRSPYSESLNNTAFVMLHQGMIDEAEGLMRMGIERGEADGNLLSNYALCCALKKDFDKAERFLDAAVFWDRWGSFKAVIAFNRALVRQLAGDEKTAAEQIKLALEANRSEVTRWVGYSVIARDHLSKLLS